MAKANVQQAIQKCQAVVIGQALYIKRSCIDILKANSLKLGISKDTATAFLKNSY